MLLGSALLHILLAASICLREKKVDKYSSKVTHLKGYPSGSKDDLGKQVNKY